jgi:hypothetical protein
VKDEQEHLEAEIAHATGAARLKLESARDELRAKQAAERERLRRRVAKLQEAWDAKIASAKSKAAAAKAETKVRHQEHVDKLSRFATAQKAAFHELFG